MGGKNAEIICTIDVKGKVMQIGAEVQSQIQASFSREILHLSVIGRITVPTVGQLKPSSKKISSPSRAVVSFALRLVLIRRMAQRP